MIRVLPVSFSFSVIFIMKQKEKNEYKGLVMNGHKYFKILATFSNFHDYILFYTLRNTEFQGLNFIN